MILALDTYYFDDKARTVCFAFENWTDNAPSQTFVDYLEPISEYEPGSFYKRELPCILQMLQQINMDNVATVIIDGYVILDNFGKFGLGGYLYQALGQRISIVGVAKTNFAANTLQVRQVIRGKSLNPLFVTAIGLDIDAAANNIQIMHGDFRIPTLLKNLDIATKSV